MTREERGRKGGRISGARRQVDVRERALSLLAGVADDETSAALRAILASGRLDGWLAAYDRDAYRRGFCARDYSLRREIAQAERAQLIADARARVEAA